MKNKVIFSLTILILLIVGIVFTNSYVQAIFVEERMINCDYNDCEQNENCPIYQENANNCIEPNKPCSQKNYNCRRNNRHQENCMKNICNR